MKRTITNLAISAAILLCPAAVLAVEPMAAAVKVSGGGVYDYVAIGERAAATDGFDNAYDSSSPGPSMNATYISTYFAHPEWSSKAKIFRGDVRSLAEKQEWSLSVATTLPAGTPLTVELDNRLNILPQGLQLTVKDSSGETSLLDGGRLTFLSPAPGTTTQLLITAIQPPSAPVVPVTPGSYAADGDVDGDGQTTIFDAVIVLNMAYGQTELIDAAVAHGDMDGDGVIRLADALAVMRKSVGL